MRILVWCVCLFLPVLASAQDIRSAIFHGTIRTTTTGTKDYVDSSFGGGNPKLACFFSSQARDDFDVAVETDMMSYIGCTDGTREGLAVGTSDDGQTTMQSWRHQLTTDVFLYPSSTTGNVLARATFDSWLTNGVRLNFTDVHDASHDIDLIIVLLGGADFDVRVDTLTSNGTVDLTTEVTNVGFTPDIVMVWTSRLATLQTGAQQNVFSWGFYDCSGDTHAGVAFFEEHNVATSSLGAIIRNDRIPTVDDAGETVGLDLSACDSQGFTATTRVNGNAVIWHYTAMSFGTAQTWVGILSSPTSTGLHEVTAPGFMPVGAITGWTLHTAVNTYSNSGGNTGSLSMCAFDDAIGECVGSVSEDNVGTNNSQSFYDNGPVLVLTETQTVHARATNGNGMVATGWEHNFSTAPGTAVQYIGFAYNATAPAAGPTLRGYPRLLN